MRSFGTADATGTYFATAAIRPGKTEIHISFLEGTAKISVSDTLSSGFELDTREELVGLDWLTKDEEVSDKKRRQSNGHEIVNANGSDKGPKSSSYLACVLETKVLVFSPFQKGPVMEFPLQFTAVASTSVRDSLWVSSGSNATELKLNSTDIKSSIQYPKAVKKLTAIQVVSIANKSYILASGEKTYIISSTGELAHTFAAKSAGALLVQEAIVIGSDTELLVYNAKSYKRLHTLKTKHSVTKLHCISGSTVAAITSSGSVEVVDISTESHVSITSNNSKVPLKGAFLKNDRLVVAWSGLVPRFESFAFNSLEDAEVDVKHTEKQNKVPKAPEPVTSALITVEEYIVRDVELATLIQEHLETEELLKVLVSNDEEKKIKTTVASLPDDVALKIYSDVSARVQDDPAESAALNNWLKWLLVNHSFALPAQAVKPLRGSLKKSLKQLPNLLALQGRLELLQSQFQLRSQQTNGAVVSKAEDSMVYVNGENDDGDVIEAAGNSQSEESGDENNGATE